MLCADVGAADYRLIVYAKDILRRKVILRQAFTVWARLASNSWWSLCFSLFCDYIYITKPTWFSLYIFSPYKFFKITAYRIQVNREESQD